MVSIEEQDEEDQDLLPSKFMQDVFSDMSYEELELKWACQDCGEVRTDEDGDLDARVEAGMKCGACAYGY